MEIMLKNWKDIPLTGSCYNACIVLSLHFNIELEANEIVMILLCSSTEKHKFSWRVTVPE